MPYTALNFQEDTKSSKLIKSLSHYSKELTGPLGLTHIMSLSQNQDKLSMRLARTPSGPTLTFKIQQFSLSKNIRQVQRRPFDIHSSRINSHPPIVVTNNFGDASASPHVKLMRITFQNMFPALNVATVKLRNCRRVVLFNFMRRDKEGATSNGQQQQQQQREEDEEVEMRHYAIRATPVGINKKVRRLIQAKIPNLSKLEDIGDYITGSTASGAPVAVGAANGGAMSDSEPEDETSQVVLPQKFAGKGNVQSHKSALKLVELGPRLRMKLTKVERGLASGDVMYHAYIHKDPQEARAIKERVEQEALLKKRRREEQEENVRRKKAALQEKLDRKKRRREEREREAMTELRGGGEEEEEEDDEDDDEDEEAS
jgi:RNA-binding protein required for 60S ribosomal subunit biogenesis